MGINMDEGFSKLEAKQDIMIEQIAQLRIEAGKTNEHLKKLNGSVARHELAIAANENRSVATDKKLAYYIGGLAALWALLQIAIKFI